MKAFVTAVAATALFAAPAFALEVPNYLLTPDVYVGLGLGNYTGDLGNLTSTGVAWNGRIGINPTPIFGAELNYQGSSTNVAAIIQQNNVAITGQTLLSSIISIDGRAGYPFRIADRELKPYAFVGVGYANIASNAFLTSIGLGGSNAFAVPVGVGASYQLSDIFSVDGRFTYDALTGTRSTIAPSGSAWNALVNVGARFGASR